MVCWGCFGDGEIAAQDQNAFGVGESVFPMTPGEPCPVCGGSGELRPFG